MFNQHAKWLDVAGKIPWRRPIASLNYLLSSHVWRQDHNGFSHQDPGFIDVVANKKAEIVRVYLPPDANTLLSVTDHCLRSRNYVNVIMAGKQPTPQWLDMDAAIKHCTAGIGIWPWASNDQGGKPDVVMACCGDVPTLETLAAVELLRKLFPELRVRVINVVDLMKLQPQHSQSAEEVLAHLGSAATGLSATEAAQRLAANGPNELKEGKRVSPLQIFLGHPIGWRHGRECARDNFHRALPVLRGRGVEMETGAKGENGAVALAATHGPTLEAPGS